MQAAFIGHVLRQVQGELLIRGQLRALAGLGRGLRPERATVAGTPAEHEESE